MFVTSASPPIQIYDRQQGRICHEDVMSREWVDFLYTHPFGRLLEHHLLSQAWVSKLGGYFKARQGKQSIQAFIDHYGINTHEIMEPVGHYATFGDFFVRQLKPEARPFPADPRRLISPADGRLLCFALTSDRYVPVKGCSYRLASLLENRALAQQFENGYVFVYRLAPVDYHRYCYIDNGSQAPVVKLKGKLHSVNPIAIDTHMPIFARNYREYTLLKTEHFGSVLHMEVGALMVGKVVSHHSREHRFTRGEEKGYFEFGGSTIIQVFMPHTIVPDQDLLDYSALGIETLVQYGSGVGQKVI
jgi:phosphatidylserine decarboxylase